MRARVLCLVGLLLLFASATGARHARAQAPAAFDDPDRAEKVAATEAAVTSMFREYREQQHMPGFAYGVVLDGELVYSGAFGLAQLDGPGQGEDEVPADTRSLFRIASMSKSFTALAILRLRDEGRLSLDDPASRYVPELGELAYLTDDAPVITIRHLLTHSAGFPEDNPWGDRQLAAPDGELRAHVAAGVPFSNVPGIAYEYSNLGFALLGQIVQVVSGMDFQDYMAEHVFGPLGMNSTVWEYERAPADRLALGYDWVDEDWVNIPLEHHGAYGAMGGLITSIEDFARYVALHMGAWPPRSGPDRGPLRRASLREMHQPWRFASLGTGECPTAAAYAYGLRWAMDCDDRVTLGHSGGLPGFGSNWTMMPDYGLAVMSFDNRTYGGTSGLNQAVLDTIVALAGLEPRRLPVSDILERRKNDLVAALRSPESAQASGSFAENFFLDTRPVDWLEGVPGVFEEAGQILGVGELVPQNQLRGTFVLECERQDIEVFFTLSPETVPLIQRVRLRRAPGPSVPVQRTDVFVGQAVREPMLVEHPGGALFVTGYSRDPHEAEDPPNLYRSDDGGASWSQVDVGTVADGALGNSDVDLVVGPDGTLYFLTMGFDRAVGEGTHVALGISRDIGRTWDWHTVSRTRFDDRPWVALTDESVHVVWNDGAGVRHAVRSHDGAWTERDRISTSGGSSHFAAGPSGELAVRITPGSASGHVYDAEADWIAISTDDGLTWQTVDAPGDRAWTDVPRWIEPIAWGPDGTLYSLWSTGGGAELRLASSTDMGRTWTERLLTGSEEPAFFPMLSVGDDGTAAASWFAGSFETGIEAHLALLDPNATGDMIEFQTPLAVDAWIGQGANRRREPAGEYFPVAFLSNGDVAAVLPIQRSEEGDGFSWIRLER